MLNTQICRFMVFGAGIHMAGGLRRHTLLWLGIGRRSGNRRLSAALRQDRSNARMRIPGGRPVVRKGSLTLYSGNRVVAVTLRQDRSNARMRIPGGCPMARKGRLTLYSGNRVVAVTLRQDRPRSAVDKWLRRHPRLRQGIGRCPRNCWLTAIRRKSMARYAGHHGLAVGKGGHHGLAVGKGGHHGLAMSKGGSRGLAFLRAHGRSATGRFKCRHSISPLKSNDFLPIKIGCLSGVLKVVPGSMHGLDQFKVGAIAKIHNYNLS